MNSGNPDKPGPSVPKVPTASTAPTVARLLVTGLLLAIGLVAGLQHPRGSAPPVDAGTTASNASTQSGESVALAAQGLLLSVAFAGLPFQASGPADVGASGAGGLPRLAPSFIRRPVLAGSTAESAAAWGVLWAAYDRAARKAPTGCHLPTTLLAAIGHVESGSLAGRRLDPDHNVVPPVLGPVLSGGRFAAIRDSDGGRWDGDRVWDRAVGPMQFIPGTWRLWGSDGSGDGVANPQNLDDAAYSAARYLCAGGRDLTRTADLRAAILAYNHSSSYLATVLALMRTIGPGNMPYVPSTPVMGVLPPRTSTPLATTSTATSSSTSTTATATASATDALPTTTTATTTTASTTTTTTSASATSDPSATSSSATSTTSTASPSMGTAAGTTAFAESGTPVPPTTP